MIEPTAAASSAQRGGATARSASGFLGKDDFLKLLVGQLRNQNPLNPMGDQDFIAQMTQMSTLEQVTNLAASNDRLDKATQVAQAVELIGRAVTYRRADDSLADGVVEHVTVDGGGPRLTVSGVPGIDPTAVTEVR